MSDAETDSRLPERTFGWWDMFVHPDDDPRTDGGPFDNERELFLAYLNDQRLTLTMKCSDLDPEQLARRSVEPSNLSLLGLVRHLAGVEQIWMRIRFAGEQVPRHYRSDEDPNGDFTGASGDPALVEDAWTTWRSECEYTDRLVHAAPDLDAVGVEGDQLRETLLHLVEEYARHLGHADFLRERIDGRVGQ
jgi:uncharacterized damage-inducible protein DinB